MGQSRTPAPASRRRGAESACSQAKENSGTAPHERRFRNEAGMMRSGCPHCLRLQRGKIQCQAVPSISGWDWSAPWIINANLVKRVGGFTVIAAPARAHQVLQIRATTEFPWQDVICIGAKNEHYPVAFQ